MEAAIKGFINLNILFLQVNTLRILNRFEMITANLLRFVVTGEQESSY